MTRKRSKSGPVFDARVVSLLKGETDRGCAIVAAVILDTLLERLLRAVMLDVCADELFDGNQPLASWSAKTTMARALAMLSRQEARELDLLRKVRNLFAHDLDFNLGFERSPVADIIRVLEYPARLLSIHDKTSSPISADEIGAIRGSVRRQFELAVGICASLLQMKVAVSPRPKDISGWMDTAERLKARQV